MAISGIVIAEKDDVFELKSETTDLEAFDPLRLTIQNLVSCRYLYTRTSDGTQIHQIR